LLAGCAPAPLQLPDAPVAPVAERPSDAERYYAIWLGGAQIGIAHETERWSPAGVVVRRTEAMRFLRGDVPVELATAIEITADAKLAPSRVTWTERAQAIRHGEAERGAAAWVVTDEAGVRRLPRAAIPAELVPLVVRRDGRFTGDVFLPARGFVTGAGRIDPVAPDRLVARLVLERAPPGAPGPREATAEATIDLGPDAMPLRVVDGEGVIATRITAAQAAAGFEPVDLIAATSLPLAGSPGPRLVLSLELDGGLALPPVPGQRMRGTGELELSAQLPGALPAGPAGADRTRAITALVARVHDRIVPDLAANPISAATAAAAVAGDCTTFALAYAALAAARAIPTRVVTGFRVDGDRLVRHRWAVSWTGRAWIAVDAAFGAVPAGGDLVGVAIHGADDGGLVAGEAALTHVRAASWK
jgi:transglutaminase-like putative cysteine protease